MGRARNWVWVVGSLYCCTSKIVFLAKMNLLRAIARYVVVGWRHFDRFHLSMPKKGEGTLQGLLYYTSSIPEHKRGDLKHRPLIRQFIRHLLRFMIFL